MERIYITIWGLEKLKSELEQLKNVARPNIIEAIAEARSHGDLSENAEYHSAKEKQSFIEGRIKELESKVSVANVVDPTKINDSKVVFGATVELVDVETEEEKVLSIVGQDEADIDKNLISISSPIAKALIGKNQGDEAIVRTPGGTKTYEIENISYKKIEV